MNVPSGYTALDLIGFTDRGDYDVHENYVKNDLVHNNGRVWLCLVDDTTGITPVAGANWKVWIDEAAYLSGLADVTISNPANGEAIRYNSQSGKWENVSVDSTPTAGSTNLVQSGGVATQLAGKANSADLATVATTGAYSDLSGTPSLAAVATSGAYSDLTGQPTIPTVNDATLTIQKNGSNVQTFTANSNTNKTANITVPDVINDLSDVNISSVANEDILVYDSTSSKWKNSGALGDVKQALSNEVVTRSTFGAHNILPMFPSGTRAGVDFTTNTDGSVLVNGTASDTVNYQTALFNPYDLPMSGDYVLSGCPIGGGASSYQLWIWDYTTYESVPNADTGNGATVTLNRTHEYGVRIRIQNGYAISNKTFYPMLRLATDTDPTYQPYAMTNKQLTKDDSGLTENAFANGAVNLLQNKASSATGSGGKVSFIVNSDGTIIASSTGQGAVTATEYVTPTSNLVLPKGTYKLSGCPTGGGSSTYRIWLGLRNLAGTGWAYTFADIGEGVTFTVDNTVSSIQVDCEIRPPYNVTSSITFKPMITVADMPNSDYNHYVPYAKSNKELTDAVGITELSTFTSYLGSTITTLFGNLIKRGKIVTINFYWEGSATNVQEIITLPSEYRPSTYRYGSGTVKYNGATEPSVYQITSDGKICQVKTGGACVGGSCSIVYSL